MAHVVDVGEGERGQGGRVVHGGRFVGDDVVDSLEAVRSWRGVVRNDASLSSRAVGL